MMKNKTYDILKKIALYYLPAVEFVMSALVKIWSIPYGSEIVATLIAIDGGLGIALGLSSKKYNELNQEFENEEDNSHEVIE